MLGAGGKSEQRLAKSLAFALAFICLFFLLHVAIHSHTNNQDEAECLLCQAAHVNATPAPSGIALSAPLIPVGEVAPPVIPSTTESFIKHSDSRGPPPEDQI